MATKVEERKALEQIRKIIEGLGPDSYIAMAMDGMIEDAEENIENDFGLSWKDRAQTAEQACDLRREQAKKLEAELKLAKNTIEQESARANSLAKTVNRQKEEVDQLAKEKWELGQENFKLKEKIGFMQRNIIELKAKLYDLMTKEA